MHMHRNTDDFIERDSLDWITFDQTHWWWIHWLIISWCIKKKVSDVFFRYFSPHISNCKELFDPYQTTRGGMFCISYVRTGNSICSTMPQLSWSEKTNWILQNNFRNISMALDLSSNKRIDWSLNVLCSSFLAEKKRFVRSLFSNHFHQDRFYSNTSFCFMFWSSYIYKSNIVTSNFIGNIKIPVNFSLIFDYLIDLINHYLLS